MATTLTITAKGQVTLKQELLNHLNVAPGQKIEAERLPGGEIIVRAAPSGSIEAFSGCLASKDGPRFTIEEINEFIAAGWAGER